MDVLLNIESDAITAERSRAEGLDTWNPAAPGMGMNAYKTQSDSQRRFHMHIHVIRGRNKEAYYYSPF